MSSSIKDFFSWQISASIRGETLLSFLKKQFPAFSAKALKFAVDEGFCRINGSYVLFASKPLAKGDFVEIYTDLDTILPTKKKKRKLQILYEDDFLIIFDKPEGFLCEENQEGVEKLFLVHRLDKKTSGVWVCAKSALSQKKMESLFFHRDVHKKYLAIVDGSIEQKSGQIESFLFRKQTLQGQTIWGSSKHQKGLKASTFWQLIKRKNNASLLLCEPFTGRTHQIRVHLKDELHHPILGDFLYAKKFRYPYFVKRMMLHSFSIEFAHPFLEKKIHVQAPIPQEFFEIMGNFSLEENFSS
jgi:23S rRNA pseudouridine955/2504/2580 synthase